MYPDISNRRIEAIDHVQHRLDRAVMLHCVDADVLYQRLHKLAVLAPVVIRTSIRLCWLAGPSMLAGSHHGAESAKNWGRMSEPASTGVWFIRIVDGVDLDRPVEAAEGRRVFELHPLP